MKIKKQLALCTALWILCTAFSACGKIKLEVPEDTTAIEKFVEETSAEITADNMAVTETPLNELEKLRWLDIKGDYAEEQLKDFDRLEYLSADVTIEILPEMDSLKCVDVVSCTDSLSILSDMEQLEAVRYSYLQKENGEIDALAANRPDLLLIYVP